ncbi:choice-of-anchor A family protein [Bifidobacterium sp. SO1]|uniref:choice-of-anchor A family protein n=1 Tax=Bifidobacterium sp. SO1 TaxID=2809029 RepID=UPI001BDD9FB4|nr:choice-of-anchor A family protein [Bifidobacterium sp. SO1]
MENTVNDHSPEKGRHHDQNKNQTAGSCDHTACRINHHPPPAYGDNSKGCITASVNATEDPAVSIYTGGNLTINGLAESEGSMVVDGNVTGALNGLAGKVMWGMGYNPPANATMLAVGGKISTKADAWTSGNVRVGGTASNQLFIANEANMRAFLKRQGYNPDADAGGMTYLESYMRFAYAGQKNAKILQNLGKTNALKVDMDGDGTLESDFNNHVTKNLIPLSDKLNSMQATGTITYEKAPDVANYGFESIRGNQWMTITGEGRIVFTGDNQKHAQVFRLDLNALDAARNTLKNVQWSLDFRNIPTGQAIVINVTGKTSYNWVPGWRVWVNGVDHTSKVNGNGADLNRFKDIASRIMWNFPNMTNLTLSGAHYTAVKGNSGWANTGIDQTTKTSKGVLFPGSILIPRGSFSDIADTNGRLLIGKNLTLTIWEHHNIAWTGFDEPQCFAVNGATKANIA